MNETPFPNAFTSDRLDRWRWRWRASRQRLTQSLSGRALVSNPRIGFIGLILLWLIGVAFGLVAADKTLHVFAGAVLNTALISLTFGVLLYLGSNRRLARRVRMIARTTPELLIAGDLTPDQVARGAHSEVYPDVAEDLIEIAPVGPQLIVGEAGSGKTSALIGVAGFLAERGMVPVYVSLRGVEELDFLELGRERFLEHVDEHVASEADGARVWRWLLRSRRVVVLADDLDQAGPAASEDDADKYAVRRALGVARRRRLALAVTARPVGIPQSLALSAVTLRPLTDELAARAVLRQLPSPRPSVAGQVDELVRAGHLGETPFYLRVVADLANADALPKPDENRHVVRVRLLRAHEGELVARRIFTEAPLGVEERSDAIRMLRALAVDRLDTLRADIPLSRVVAVVADGDPLQLVDAAQLLGVLERGAGTVRFVHEIVQSYLASAVLSEDDALVRRVCRAPKTTRALNALILAAAWVRTPAFVASAREALLDCAKRRDDDWGLAIVRAAADVSRTSPEAKGDDDVVAAAQRYAPIDVDVRTPPRANARSLTKLAALPRFTQTRANERWRLLWAFTNDADYSVKWEAASELRANAVEAYEALGPSFDDYLKEADELHACTPATEIDDWDNRTVFRLKMLGWVLPALATSLERAGQADLTAQADDQWRRLSALQRAPITVQKGLEAAVSQGLKIDALALRSGSMSPVGRAALTSERALDMLASAGFWYTQIQLVHAASLLASPTDSALLRSLGEIVASPDQHPFTAAAARLAVRSIEAGEWSRDVWEEESVVVGGRCSLSDEAAQLAADITLVLNLNEQGGEQERAAFGTWRALPHCLSTSPDRGEILGRRPCPEHCPFKRCAYFRPTTETAHRELSKAFCRQQRRIAARRVPEGWQAIKKGELIAFWEGMEERSRA